MISFYRLIVSFCFFSVYECQILCFSQRVKLWNEVYTKANKIEKISEVEISAILYHWVVLILNQITAIAFHEYNFWHTTKFSPCPFFGWCFHLFSVWSTFVTFLLWYLCMCAGACPGSNQGSQIEGLETDWGVMNVLIPGTPPIPTKNDWFDKSV